MDVNDFVFLEHLDGYFLASESVGAHLHLAEGAFAQVAAQGVVPNALHFFFRRSSWGFFVSITFTLLNILIAC